MKTTVSWPRAGRRGRSLQRRLAWTAIVTILALLLSLFPQVAGLPASTASAHNLDSGFVYMFFDPATQAAFDAFIAANPPGTPLLQDGQTVGIIIKVVPSEGTNTGVGGYVDFYVPDGVQVTDVAYLVPDGSGGYVEAPIKGQSPIAVGDGPVGTNCTPALGTAPPLTLGPNIIGTTAQAVVTTTGCHNGTIAGVYADTGIFYSTDPRTAHGTYSGGALKNNSGDTVGLRTIVGTVPNLWDAQQLAAYGIAGSANPAFPSAPIVDPNGRGNAPWGNANAVAGPQSGYAWEFNKTYWDSSAKDAAAMKAASSFTGPWQRIQYPGSQIAKDQPGLKSTLLGYAGVDGSQVGWALSAGNPLTTTVSQTDAVSPKTIRWAIGQLTYLKPEYVWVQFKVIDRTQLATANGSACPVFYGDTFGGDAGGTDSGKDHIWRYYDPNGIVWNACLGGGKPDNVPAVKVGDIFQYKVKVYNYGLIPLTNVVVKDLLPSGVSFVSAVPAQSSGPNPLQWTVGTIPVGGKFEATVTVKATGSGVLQNALTITSNQGSQTVYEQTPSGAIPILTQTKSVAPAAVAPGGSVTYTIVSKNIGTGATGSPVKITEYLPAGFTYTSLVSVTVNGASYTGTTAVSTTNPNQPVFTLPASIQAGKELRLVFTATVNPATQPAAYCNSYQLLEGATPYTTGALACVQVAGGKIGDTIWRDWDGDGAQDAGEEGVAGVTVKLYEADGVTLKATTTTDANGNYYFPGLVAGTYVVQVNNGAALPGTTQTGDPDGTVDNRHTVILATDQQYMAADFGYKPAGAGVIGDTVFEDVGNDGAYNVGTDTGIAGVTVALYEDTDGDGVITPGVDALVATTISDASGSYSFTGLAEGFDYLVKVDTTDPDIQAYFNSKYDPDPVPYLLSTAEAASSLNLSGSDLDNDFGFWKLAPASIGDQVFMDNNGDGVYGAGDAPLAGVTVNLYRDGVLVATTASGPDGAYLFGNLGPGNYTVAVDAADPDLPGGVFAAVSSYAKTLAAGEDYLAADFPFVKGLTKSVDKSFVNPAGTLAERTMTFSLKPYYPGGDLLENVRIIDPLPIGTTYVASSANAGGVYGAYTPLAAVPGQDTGGGPLGTTTLDTALTVSANFVNTGGAVNVTLNVKQNSGSTVNNVAPSPLTVNGGAAVCTGPTPATANVPTGTTGSNFVWACTLSDAGEYTFGAAAANDTATYSWPDGRSASVLSAPDGGPNVVTWSLGSNTAGVPGETLTSGYTAGVYAFRGGNTREFSKYGISAGTWTSKAQPTNGIEKGGSLTGNGAGTLYALEGNSKVFYKYTISTNTWSTLASTSDNVNEGGAAQYLKIGANEYVFALLGNSTRFRRYNITDPDGAGPITANSWTVMAATPANVAKGGALTTDGTYLYAFQGDRKTGFWRCNATTTGSAGSCDTSWTVRAPAPGNVGWGGALTRIGNYLYAFQGNGATTFWRYDITADTWSVLAPALGVVNNGGSLTTDGTYIYALQGGTKTYWRYNPATNAWAPLASANFLGNVGQGGALAYDPGLAPVGRFTSMVATPSLVATGDQVTVRLTLQSSTAVSDVAAGALTATPTGGAACSSTTGPTLVSADDDIVDINDPVIYQWICTVAAGASPGSLTFSAGGTGAGPVSFPAAQSKSVLVSPVLTFQASVNTTGAPAVIENTGLMAETSGAFGSLTSNTTETATAGSISNFVWADLDGDGVQDAGEPGLSGVEVCVYASDGVTLVACDVTDANGAYRIHGLGAGDYVVRSSPATYPAGYLPTTVTSLDVTLAVGQQYDAADFGLDAPGAGSISDLIWLDADNDGAQDTGEAGLPGITVTLEKCVGGVCTPVATAVTDADGLYAFDGLVAGDYRVVVDTASDVTSPYASGAFDLAAAMDPTYDRDGVGTPDVAVVTLASDSSVVTDADFGYNWSGAIGDYVWWDADAEGDQDEGVPVVGAVVLLYFDADNNGLLEPWNGDYQIGIDWTDATGAYRFENLPPGNYLVDVYEDSLTTGGIRDVVPTTDNVVVKSLGAGETYLDADFGYYQGARVEGDVFWDVNHNGVFDDGATGLKPITVYLCAAGADPCDAGSALQTTTTDADGHYFFLAPEGDYTLAYATGGTAAYPDTTTPASYTFHAYPGEDWHPSFDFGVDHSGAIGDTVWNDADNDGVQDAGETGMSGVTVNLYAADGITFIASTVTDADGLYEFPGLADGSYVVKVDTATVPVGFANTYDEDSGTTSPNSQTAATVSGGAPHLTADFGYYNAVSYAVSGNVFNDLTNLGVKDGTDTGLAGVTVHLYDSTGTTVIATATTDSSGNYTFPGVPNGSYTVKVDTATLSPAYQATYESDGSVNNAIPVTVAGADQTGKGFGFHEYLGSLSGTVCVGSGDGVCAAGEPPLAAVTVTLSYAGADSIFGTADDATATVLTDASGQYTFTNLLPGLYQVSETNPDGFTSLADRDGGNPDNITVVLDFGPDGVGGTPDDRLVSTDQDFEDYGGADLQVAKTDNATTVLSPATVVYTLTVTNAGTAPAAGVVLSDTLGANLTYVADTCGAPTINGSVYTWSLGTLAAGASTSCLLTVTVAGSLPAGTQLTNRAAVSTTSIESNITNNEVVDIDEVTATLLPDLRVTKSDGVTRVLAGQQITYTIQYANVGPAAATAVVITDSLPTNATYVASVPPGVQAGAILTWTVGALGAGASGVITVTVTADADLLRGAVILNRVSIAGAEEDANPADNFASDSDAVVAPYVIVEKSAAGSAYVGGEVTYTIQWRNTSTLSATDVVISDTLPVSTALVSGSITGGGTLTGNTITWVLGDQPAGASGALSFKVTLLPGVSGTAVAQTTPTLTAEAGAGSVTVTSKTAAYGSLPWCDKADCLTYRGVYQAEDGLGPIGWNDNPRAGARFDDSGWTQPVTATIETDYWLDQAALGAEWTSVHTAGELDPNYSFFRQAFCLPLNASGITATLRLSSDDVSDIYLNGAAVGQHTGAGGFSTLAGSGIQSGINILAVRLLNNNHGGHPLYGGEDHSGLLFNLESSYSTVRPFAYAPTMVLADQPITFSADENALGGRKPYSYTLSFGDSSAPAPYQLGATFTHTYTAPGVYVATMTARAVYGCTGSDQITITVLPSPTPDNKILNNTAELAYENADGVTYTGESGAGIPLSMGAVAGRVYADTNGNGVYDAGDVLAAGVTAVVTDTHGITHTGVTDASGYYTVTEVAAGPVMVDLLNPPAGSQTQGTDPTTPVNVVAGLTTFEENNGYFSPATVTGHLFVDTDGDGTQDAGEPDLAGVTVMITDSTGASQAVVSDSTGVYTATVPPGTTTANVVEGTLPAGYVQTAGTDPTTVTAVAGASVSIGEDGYQPRGTLTGEVFADLDGDGVRDAGEGLPGVQVWITPTVGAPFTVTTTADGLFSASVPAGNTLVDVVDADLPADLVQAIGTDPTSVTVPSGGTAHDVNGYRPLGTLAVDVFHDLDGDGVHDPGEGLAGVDVLITPSVGAPFTVTTDVNGWYTVTVPAGVTYVDIEEGDLPAGLEQTVGADPSPVTVPWGGSATDVNGYEAPAIGLAKQVVGVINNGDGTFTVAYSITVQNVAGITLSDVRVADSLVMTFAGATSWSVVAGSLSATGGLTVNPAFNGDTDQDLLAGADALAPLSQGTISFRVRVQPATNPASFDNAATGQGLSPAGRTVIDVSTDGADTDPDTGGAAPGDNRGPGDDSVPTPVTLAQYFIGDTVWLDADGNGVPDPGEQGLYHAPVTVTGTDVDGGAVNITVYTDLDGHYLVPLNKAGVYTVTTPATVGGFLLETPASGFYTVTLTPAAPATLTADFGYSSPTGVSVSGFGGALAGPGIRLTWQVSVPDGVPAPLFHINRSTTGAAGWIQLTAAGPVSPAAPDGGGLTYAFTDVSAQPGTSYWYQLVDAEAPAKVYGPWEVKGRQVFLPLLWR